MAQQKGRKLPPSIRLTPAGKYRPRVTYLGRRQHIGTFHTIQDAQAALDIACAEIARGIFIPLKESRAQERERRERGALSTLKESQGSARNLSTHDVTAAGARLVEGGDRGTFPQLYPAVKCGASTTPKC
jgi:hypothetical protein